ncbi:homoserine O-succinyltransferase MetX [Hyphococcus sp.]|uniref:homoserine O-succinyltransferase MetX n=1 Tax=Hyphococcus sp. TaxID=2038636 RepID=UPI003CCC3FAD
MTTAQTKTEESACRKTVSFCEVSVFLPGDIELDSGERLSKPELTVRVYGDLTQPVVIAAGGVSAGRNVADTAEETGWWRDFAGAGRAIDLDRFCLVGFDFLPGDGEAARTISTKDQARALGHALDIIGVETVEAFVGASYGGMVALCFAELFPERIKKVVAISAPDRPNPAATAQRGVQRRIIEFAEKAGDAQAGVALARQLAMVSYRTPEEFGTRFASAPRGGAAGDPYDICEYLVARGEAYAMKAPRYLTLSDSIDRHRADTSKIGAQTLVIAVSSDRLSPPADLERLAGAISGGRFIQIESPYGHDAFLKEPGVIGPHISEFLKEPTS